MVKSYCYLGVIFTCNGTFAIASQSLAEKARKVSFMLNRKVTGDNDVNLLPPTQLFLFDTYVKPILLHGSEVWSSANCRNRANILKDPHTQNAINISPIDKVQTDYCKYILGLGQKASNTATLAELGRYSLDIEIKVKIIKFWYRIISMPENHILYKSYKTAASLDDNGFCSWASTVRLILQNNGFNYIWLRQTSPDKINIDRLLTKLTSVLKDQYQQLFHGKIWDDDVISGTSNKLCFYRKFKSAYDLEPYLKFVHRSQHRKFLTKLRISNHCLRIETGRYCNEKREERKCQFCNTSSVESETHFILYCPAYDDLRTNFFDYLANFIPNFSALPDEVKLKHIIDQPQKGIARESAQYVFACFNHRKSKLCT